MSIYGQESRQVELDGITRLQGYFGESATVIDLGHTGGHDFEIHYQDSRLAIGEFTWLVEPKSLEMWKAILKRDDPQQIALPTGWGHWVMTLGEPININQLENLATKWISEVSATGRDNIELHDVWPNTVLARKLRGFGISRIHKFSEEPDQITFMVMGKAGAVPWDLIPLCGTIIELLSENPTVRSNFEKLQGKKADEKHVYLRLGGLVPSLQTWALYTEREPVDIPEINFPQEITHVWLESGNDQVRSILWEHGNNPKYF